MLGVEGSGHWVTPARESGAEEEWSRMGSEREGASPGEPELQAQCNAIHSHEVEGSHMSNWLTPSPILPAPLPAAAVLPWHSQCGTWALFYCPCCCQGKTALPAPSLDWIFLSVWVGFVVFVCLGFGLGFIFLSLHSMQTLVFELMASAPAYSGGNRCQWAAHHL